MSQQLEVKSRVKSPKHGTPPVLGLDLVSFTPRFLFLERLAQYTIYSYPISIMLLQNQMKFFSRYFFIAG
jgi:hypothetical protein